MSRGKPATLEEQLFGISARLRQLERDRRNADKLINGLIPTQADIARCLDTVTATQTSITQTQHASAAALNALITQMNHISAAVEHLMHEHGYCEAERMH